MAHNLSYMPSWIVMLRRLIIAIAVASALGISFCPTDASARRTRAAVATASQAGIKPQAAAPQPRLHTAERPVKD